MGKSIIIFGKGPSVLKCTRKIVDEYNDIAIINYPVINDFFFSLIKNREIKYHFSNCATYDARYNDYTNEKLNIEGIYNTHYSNQITNYKNYINQKDIFRDSIREKGEEYLKINGFDFDPSSGTLAFQYILGLNIYDKICLVGFDCFKKNECMYYYNVDQYNKEIKYLINNNIITNNGILLIDSGHNAEKTREYYEYEINNNKNINFIFITNMAINHYENLKIL